MEFKFDLAKLLMPDAQGFVVLDGAKGNPAFESEKQRYGQKSSLFSNGSHGPHRPCD